MKTTFWYLSEVRVRVVRLHTVETEIGNARHTGTQKEWERKKREYEVGGGRWSDGLHDEICTVPRTGTIT